MGRVRVFVPTAPEDLDAILDAFLIFAPELFHGCVGLEAAVLSVERSGSDRLDFNVDGLPDGWAQLRDHARSVFKNLPIYSADLVSINR